MKLEKVIPAYRKGKKIRRKCWNEEKVMDLCFVKGIRKYVYVKEGQFRRAVIDALLEADDWEIVKEKKKIKIRDLTEEQYVKWRENSCCANICASSCPFRCINCSIGRNNYKEFYSDKFLDQEIEVEE